MGGEPLRGRFYFGDSIETFCARDVDYILGALVRNAHGDVDQTQISAWSIEIRLLQDALRRLDSGGQVFLEYSVPRLGKRIDAVVATDNVIFVIEFKVGASMFNQSARDQACDYALDLKYFHETSHDQCLVPLVVATDAPKTEINFSTHIRDDNVLRPVDVGNGQLHAAMASGLAQLSGPPVSDTWAHGRYSPTPTIVEAAVALYAGHTVKEISRHGADETNLSHTSEKVVSIVQEARAKSTKAVCFVTGVPGAGKTLVGLDVAHRHMDPNSELYSVYLSGNGPLVAVLREALVRDRCAAEREAGRKTTKGAAGREVKAFIQNVHHFRDEYLVDMGAPREHVALFDEAQRAWTKKQTASFMKRKKGISDFDRSEPAFLLSCMDRHDDWAVVVGLVGHGQEINTGEGGIREWLLAVQERFPGWEVHASPQLRDPQYNCVDLLDAAAARGVLRLDNDLHLSVSMRSFRADSLSEFVQLVLELDGISARELLANRLSRYPIVLTRSLDTGKRWVAEHARGTERYGLIVSSQAYRLKPHAVDVRVPVDPVHWFLGEPSDVRSSYYLEDAATEFHVQGLELDWACVVWDGDMRHASSGWVHREFKRSKWIQVRADERRRYQLNAYRVLLTRARQGMAIVVPEGSADDPTRSPAFYDPTFEYLRSIGLPVI